MTTTDSDLSLPIGRTTTSGGTRMAKYSAEQLRSMLARGQAFRNANGEPSFPIADVEDLDKAINAVGRAGSDHGAVRQYITKRAKSLKKQGMIPKSWSAAGDIEQERAASQALLMEGATLAPVLVLEGAIPKPVIVQEATAENGGVMRIKVPFYVGESVARAPGIDKRIYFPKSMLPSIVQEGKRQIAEGKQPLTVYARHAHATSGDHLPVGALVELEQEGRIGYTVLEVSPTSTGHDVQVLAKNKHLNAVSLRSGPGRFELEERKVNGEAMYTPRRLALDGVDFAPDSPAQPTYGLEILQEDASLAEIAPLPPKRRTPNVPDELTLDTFRVEYPDLVNEIEAPLQRENAKLTSQLNILLAEKTARLRDEKLREIAADFPDPDKALPLLQEVCTDCETEAEVAARAFPILRKALASLKQEGPPSVERPAQEVLLEMFRPGGAGNPTLVQETPKSDDIDPASLAGIELAEV